MQHYIIRRDGKPDLEFDGELLASVSSSPENGSSGFSGSPGRWTELELYRTRGGKYVAASIGCTRWEGEHDRYKAAACETIEEVAKFFGYGWLAKELYETAGITITEWVD